MKPSFRHWIGLLACTSACSTQAPPPLSSVHPAHAQAALGSTNALPQPLSGYRDFTPPGRASRSRDTGHESSPPQEDSHAHPQ